VTLTVVARRASILRGKQSILMQGGWPIVGCSGSEGSEGFDDDVDFGGIDVYVY
jgi:hypothetical protein